MTKQQNTSALLDSALALLKQGNTSKAETALITLLEQSPKHLDALYYLSLARFNMGKIEAAIEALDNSLTNSPDDPRALSALANIYGHTGNPNKGIELYQRCIELAPNNANFFNAVASFLVLVGRSDDAITNYQSAIKLQPNWPEPYHALASLYQKANRYDLAESALKRAIENKVFALPIILQLSEIMEQQGKIDEAKTLLSNGLAVHKGNLSLLAELVRLDKKLATPELKQQLSSIPANQLPLNDQFCQHYVMAICEKNAHNYAAEMALLVTTHSLFKSSRSFNLSNEFYFNFLANRTPSPETALTIKSPHELSEFEPIFIVGVPRSGSTLIENVICSANKDILRGEEVNALSTAIAHVRKSEPPTNASMDAKNLIAPVLEIYQSINLLQPGRRFTDKSLENVLYLDLLLALFPKAKIIYCERSPIDSIVSIMRNVLSSLSWAHDINDILKYFDQCFNAIASAKAMFPEQIYTFKYEAFIENSEDESKALLAFCDIEWTPDCLKFHQDRNKVSRTTSTAQIREGVNKKGLNAGSAHQAFFEPYMESFPWLKPRT